MRIVVRYITALREITKKENECLELPQSATVNTVLETLSQRYSDRFRQYLFENGRLRSELHLLVNHKPLRLHQNFETPLRNNDEITFIPTFFPVSGG